MGNNFTGKHSRIRVRVRASRGFSDDFVMASFKKNLEVWVKEWKNATDEERLELKKNFNSVKPGLGD